MYQYDIYLVKLEGMGSEQTGIRPCIIVSNNVCNKVSPVITVIPLTTKIKNTYLKTHCTIRSAPKLSIAMAEQIKVVDKKRVLEYINTLNETEIKNLKICIKIQLNL